MKIITCTGYYGSGSSAVSDLVAEYDNVKDLTDYEFRFLHDIDGVSDLEFHLVECHNRHNSGHALKRFERLSRFNAGKWFNSRYEPFFNNQYMKLTNEYILSLTDHVFKSWWFYDLYDKGIIYYYFMQLLNRFLRKIPGNHKGILANEITYCSHPSEEKFLSCTRDYVSKLLRAANPTNLPFIEVDQLVPSQNINRILRYFSDDIYVFVVNRDPRDIYISAKYYWKDNIIPYEDVNNFCDWYLYTVESGSDEVHDPKKVKKIQFEDLIFHYHKTVKEIEEMTGLQSKGHSKQFSKFNPLRSVNNTQIWKKHDIAEDISIIEERLTKYLYPFDTIAGSDIPGINPSDNTVF